MHWLHWAHNTSLNGSGVLSGACCLFLRMLGVLVRLHVLEDGLATPAARRRAQGRFRTAHGRRRAARVRRVRLGDMRSAHPVLHFLRRCRAGCAGEARERESGGRGGEPLGGWALRMGACREADAGGTERQSGPVGRAVASRRILYLRRPRPSQRSIRAARYWPLQSVAGARPPAGRPSLPLLPGVSTTGCSARSAAQTVGLRGLPSTRRRYTHLKAQQLSGTCSWCVPHRRPQRLPGPPEATRAHQAPVAAATAAPTASVDGGGARSRGLAASRRFRHGDGGKLS